MRDYWTLLDRGLEAAFDGDGTVLALLADAYASRAPDGTFLNNSTEAIAPINCLDDPSTTPVDQVEAELPAFEQVSPTLAANFAWSLVGCVGFEPRAAEPRPTIRAEGAAPIVIHRHHPRPGHAVRLVRRARRAARSRACWSAGTATATPATAPTTPASTTRSRTT